MKRALYILITLLIWPVSGFGSIVTDDAGRAVSVPDELNRVYAAGPPATIFLYTLAPDLLLGWNRPLRAGEREYIPARYRDIPALGRLTGRGNTANAEIVIRAGAQLILDYGSTKAVYVSLADRVQEQTGIPYLLMDGSFRKIPTTYRRLGKILGRMERGEALARYAEQTFARVRTTLAAIPAQDRPRVYYGRGPDGLQTGAGGAINIELLGIAGAINVAAEAGGDRRGLIEVSMEQILQWDPEVILTLDANFYKLAQHDPLWSRISAVRKKRVYLAPRVPFGWFDRPPSVNRLIGLHWLLHTLYPEQAQLQLRAIAREFYALFYHVELDDAQLGHLLSDSQ